ncbi:hypothetical protein GOODEAATRI_032910, partial [Goodea atripinnis]
VVCLQSYVRRWLAQEAVEQLKKERTRRLAWFEMQDRRCKEEKEEQLRDRRNRWMNPQSTEDFSLLYHALESRPESNGWGLVYPVQSAAPHQWESANGRLLEMDTAEDIRARELEELYNEISLYTVDKQQRLTFLKKLKNNVKVYKKPSELKHNMFFCHGCHRYLCSADFGSCASGRRSHWCRNCTRLDNIARSRDEDSVYKSILRRLRSDEHRLKTEATIPFLLQVSTAFTLCM